VENETKEGGFAAKFNGVQVGGDGGKDLVGEGVDKGRRDDGKKNTSKESIQPLLTGGCLQFGNNANLDFGLRLGHFICVIFFLIKKLFLIFFSLEMFLILIL
jgi:hypothetical protein